MPPLTYILRLIVLRRLIWPSTCPLIHGSTIAFLIASLSCLSALAIAGAHRLPTLPLQRSIDSGGAGGRT
jgi:hypothetical protein